MTITAPASAYLGGDLDRTGRETGALLNDLRSVVEYARAQDDATAGSLSESVPSGQTGFGTASPGTIARAEELARRLKDPTYQPTFAELDELRDLINLHGREPAFAHTVLNTLGPKGLLQLSGALATYQLDYPGRDVDSMLFDRDTADMVRDLQNGLGVMLWFLFYNVSKTYRMLGHLEFEGGGRSPFELGGNVLEAGGEHKVSVCRAQGTPVPAVIEFRFYPPLAADPGESWSCPCGEPEAVETSSRGHWVV